MFSGVLGRLGEAVEAPETRRERLHALAFSRMVFVVSLIGGVVGACFAFKALASGYVSLSMLFLVEVVVARDLNLMSQAASSIFASVVRFQVYYPSTQFQAFAFLNKLVEETVVMKPLWSFFRELA